MTISLDDLSEEQRALLPVYRDKWIDIALTTDRIDKVKTTKKLKALYRQHRLKLQNIIWCASPMSMLLMDVLANHEEQVLCYDLETCEQNKTFLEIQQIALDLIPQEKLASLVRERVNDCIYGQQESCWISFYDYMRNVLGFKKETDEIQRLQDLVPECSWLLPREGVCFVSDKPVSHSWNANDELHNDKGPAIGFRDGFGIYIWRNIRIPPEWIRDNALTAEIALTWPNVEQRRVACELMGWNNILKELDCKTIDDDGDPEIGMLIEANIPNLDNGRGDGWRDTGVAPLNGRTRFLVVRCGTGRDFALPVPPTMQTALEAQAWTWGLELKDFSKPEVRT